jgi:hypothetical protein
MGYTGDLSLNWDDLPNGNRLQFVTAVIRRPPAHQPRSHLRIRILVGRTGHYLNFQIELARGVLDLIKAHRERLEPRLRNRQSHVVRPQPGS